MFKDKNHFHFRYKDNLKEVCNAPTDKSGVYIVYRLVEGKEVLLYIGCSGRIKKDGAMFIRKTGLGGIKDRLVNGHQFGKISRKHSWPIQMQKENITALNIYWFITHNKNYNDCPRKLEKMLLKEHFGIYGRLPKWNKKLY